MLLSVPFNTLDINKGRGIQGEVVVDEGVSDLDVPPLSHEITPSLTHDRTRGNQMILYI